MIFELSTGDLLFDPRGGADFGRDEDHLALMIELMGKMPRKFALSGKLSRDFFNKDGELKRIKKLKFWSLEDVLKEKYMFSEEDAGFMASCLNPMLDFLPDRRASAAQSSEHPWLSIDVRIEVC